jgi:crotonobetainyl-CoA:carnitine CoA-transferase CaiB-like acyl-CoA transferase
VAIAILAALQGRSRTGEGGHVDFSMLDGQVALLTLAAARYFALGEVPPRLGTEHPGRVPSAAFECADGRWLHISGSDQHWPPLCTVLGLDALAGDVELARNAGRVARRVEVMQALSGAIARRGRDELAAALRAAGVPAGEVNSVAEVFSDPHVTARGMVGAFDHPRAGRVKALRTPLRFDGFDDPEPAAPPLLGGDTDAVLTERLGFGPAEIEALRAQKVI